MKILLSELLESKKMTQAELARLSHIRPSTVCDMYNNNCSFIKLEHIDRICKVLDCRIEELITLSKK